MAHRLWKQKSKENAYLNSKLVVMEDTMTSPVFDTEYLGGLNLEGGETERELVRRLAVEAESIDGSGNVTNVILGEELETHNQLGSESRRGNAPDSLQVQGGPRLTNVHQIRPNPMNRVPGIYSRQHLSEIPEDSETGS